MGNAQGMKKTNVCMRSEAKRPFDAQSAIVFCTMHNAFVHLREKEVAIKFFHTRESMNDEPVSEHAGL